MVVRRAQFWQEADSLLRAPGGWSARFQQLDILFDRYEGGRALLHTAPYPNTVFPNSLAPPLPEEVRGMRCFLKSWEAGEVTGIHGHPGLMYVRMITAQLECVHFQREGDRVVEESRGDYGPGEVMVGIAENERYDNFIHQLRCVQPGWSVHLYSDSGVRGVRFDADHTLEQAG